MTTRFNDAINEPMVSLMLQFLGVHGHQMGLVSWQHRHFLSGPFATSLERRSLALLAASGFSLVEAKTEAGDIWSFMIKAAPVLGVVDPRQFPGLQHPPGM